MEGLLRFPVDHLPFVFLAIVFAFTVHEFAHAYAADKFGDPTPRSMGRVTLNPRSHIDIFGTILILIAGFGWAKPVLIRAGNFKKPRIMNIIVSLVGPLANLVLTGVGLLLAYAVGEMQLYNSISPGAYTAIGYFLLYLVYVNFMLFLFNLIPLPPLDGYRIVFEFLPLRLQLKAQSYEQWGMFIFLILIFVPPLRELTIGQLFDAMDPVLRMVVVFLNNF